MSLDNECLKVDDVAEAGGRKRWRDYLDPYQRGWWEVAKVRDLWRNLGRPLSSSGKVRACKKELMK